MADCLATMVGIVPEACPCFGEIPVDAYTTSDSGFYLNDAQYGIPSLSAILANLSECEPVDSNVYTILNKARLSAIRDFKTDLSTALSEVRSMPASWKGMLAKSVQVVAGTLTQKAFAGQQLYATGRQIDMQFIVTHVYVGANFTGAVTLNFESNNGEFTAVVVPGVPTESGRFLKHELETPVPLPLYWEGDEELFYNVYWEPETGQKPLLAKMVCCGWSPGWLEHFDAGGFHVDDLGGNVLRFRSSMAHGVILGGYMDCDQFGWICNLDQLNGYSWKQLVGRTLLFKSTLAAYSGMMRSGNVNFHTLLQSETIDGYLTMLRDAYTQNIDYIANSLPAGFTSCWGCNNDDFQVTKIIS